MECEVTDGVNGVSSSKIISRAKTEISSISSISSSIDANVMFEAAENRDSRVSTYRNDSP
jgi:hypothetical protein